MKAQNYTPFYLQNTEWIMDHQSTIFQIGGGISHNYVLYKTNGDTIINGLNYTKISTNTKIDYCYLREQGKKVYCRYDESIYGDSTEFLLYDFSLDAGDTMFYSGPPNYSYNIEHGEVYGKDSILINGRYHNRMYVNGWAGFEFIEGIGSTSGLMYNEIPWVDNGGELYCFSKNDTVFKTDGTGGFEIGKCDMPSGITHHNDNNLKVYPNPSNDFIKIETDDFSSYEIYNVLGEIVKKGTEKVVMLQYLKSGNYILRIYGKNSDYYQKIEIKL
ncbi:MAG: T9SS type A sorting domain-containing protein [Chitinophagales bacterium]